MVGNIFFCFIYMYLFNEDEYMKFFWVDEEKKDEEKDESLFSVLFGRVNFVIERFLFRVYK